MYTFAAFLNVFVHCKKVHLYSNGKSMDMFALVPYFYPFYGYNIVKTVIRQGSKISVAP